jgi:hypothetical protein
MPLTLITANPRMDGLGAWEHVLETLAWLGTRKETMVLSDIV